MEDDDRLPLADVTVVQGGMANQEISVADSETV
jgi:hypothetical protein